MTVHFAARARAEPPVAFLCLFALTNNSRLRQELRLKLLETKSRHTLIATEVVARRLWYFFGEKCPLKTAVANH